MISYAGILIQATLIGSVVATFLASGIFFAEGFMGGGVIWLIFALVSACYAYMVWSRIPFAAATLKTGLSAVRSNLGLTAVAVGSLLVASVWTTWWLTNYLGIAQHLGGGDEDNAQKVDGGIVFLLLICFYWGHQVRIGEKGTNV